MNEEDSASTQEEKEEENRLFKADAVNEVVVAGDEREMP